MTRIPLNLDYRGDRSYLHGTDLFNAFVKHVKPVSNIRMRLYRPMIQQLELAAMDTLSADEKTKIAAVLESETPSGAEVWCAFENPNLGEPGRYPVDEQDIVQGAEYADNRLTQNTVTHFSAIERIVGLNKTLLTSVFPEKSTKWWFTRIDLSWVPENSLPLTLQYKSSLGTKLVSSEISTGSRVLGTIYFTEK